MMNSERRAKVRVFLRVGMFAIAAGLSAVAFVRIFEVSRQIQTIQKLLASAQINAEEITRENDRLEANVKLQVSHHASAIRDADYVARFFQICREPNDIPQLKTDFIIREDNSFAVDSTDFAFSVPEGRHTLQISFSSSVSKDPETTLQYPLLPSSGYFARIYSNAGMQVKEPQLFIDLTSNNAAFEPIRNPLPIENIRRLPTFSLSSMDEVIALTQIHTRGGLQSKSFNGHEYLIYPNMNPQSMVRPTLLGDGFEVRTGFVTSVHEPIVLRLSITSDSPECISASAATRLRPRSQLSPYTGTGRFFVRPKN